MAMETISPTRCRLHKKHGSKVVAIYELADYIASKGVADTIGMNLGGAVRVERRDRHDGRCQTLRCGGRMKRACIMSVLPRASCWSLRAAPCSITPETRAVFGDMQFIREFYEPA